MSTSKQTENDQSTCLQWPLNDIIAFARRYALTHRLLSLVPNNLNQAAIIPFSLYPSPFSFENFQSIWSIQHAYNRLYHKLSLDDDILEVALAPVIPLDDFVARLWNIHRRAPRRQPICFDIYRNDYMFDTKINKMRQIEFNTISAAFAGLTSVVADLQQAVLRFALNQYPIRRIQPNDTFEPSSNPTVDLFLPNEPAKKLAEAMVKAFELYQNDNACILFVVIAQERNVCDQNGLIDAIEEQRPSTRIYLKTFEQLTTELVYDDKTSKIFLRSTHEEIAVVYYRAGYMPENYVNEQCWAVRETIEQSQAIKCPTIRSQLAGCKMVQEYLARPGIVEKYIQDVDLVGKIRSTFAEMFRFDDSNCREHYRNILRKNPHDYVLKPQREGGGNNKYDDELLDIIENHQDQLNTYIAMEKIRPPTCQTCLIKSNGENLLHKDCINEIGIYGTMLVNTETNEEYINQTAGYLVRTKTIDTNEGGVASGYSVLDCLNFGSTGRQLAIIFSKST